MRSVNMRQLRDTRQLKTWLAAGQIVELRDRDRVIAHIVPERVQAEPAEWPDFAARAKKTFGNRKMDAVKTFLETRHGRY